MPEVLAGRREDRGDGARRREGDRLHAGGDRAVRTHPGERLEVLGARVQHPRERLVGQERLGQHGLAVTAS